MLKGHVFSRQLFGNPIFALFINTFLNGANGISNNYKNGMAVSYSGTNVTIDSGAICIQGRFLEEDTTSTFSAGTETAFCKLIIEVDLNKQNTEVEFNQGLYKIIKGANEYPNLTQNNIVQNNSGIYQYELARFKVVNSSITEFQDMRTFLDFESIYSEIRTSINNVISEMNTEFLSLLSSSETNLEDLIEQIREELDDVEDGSIYVLKGGNAGSATKLETERRIALRGAVSGSVMFDGTENAVIDTTVKSGTELPTGGEDGEIYIQIF